MRFSIISIIQNRGIYISTLLTFIVLAYLTIFSKYWILEYQTLASMQKELSPKHSFVIKKDLQFSDSKAIDMLEIEEVEKILGKYDSIIKKLFYRVEFSGLAKNGDLRTEFKGFGIDLKRDEDSLNRYIFIERGESLTDKSKNSIIISQTMASKLKVDINESLEIFILNRDNEMIDEVVNIASLKVNGIFKEPFEESNMLFLSIRLSDFILKTSDLDSIIVEFYLQNDADSIREELNLQFKDLGLKIEDNISQNRLEIFDKIVNTIYIFILFLVLILAYRDTQLLIERKRTNIRTLIHHNWKFLNISILNIQESIIFNLSAFIITFIIVTTIFSLNIGYPSIFTSVNIPIYLDPKLVDIMIYIIPLFILNFIVQNIGFIFFANFKRD